MRLFPVALAVILGVALLAACGGGTGETEEGDTATPTAAAQAAAQVSATATQRAGATTTPRASATATQRAGATGTPGGSPSASPTGGNSAQEMGCDFPSDIESFRFEMTMKANVPSTPEVETPESEEPLGDLLGALSGLMGDMKMEGAVIVPDRSSMEMTIGGHEFGSFVQIGSQSWTKLAGLTDWTEQPSSEEGFLFSPLDFCETAEEDLTSALSELEGEKEEVNGIDAVHYHLDKAHLAFLEEFVGETEDLAGVPEEFSVDVWLAEDGDWPVRMSLEASGEDEEGQSLSFEISFEFKDFNDSSIKIEPPT